MNEKAILSALYLNFGSQRVLPCDEKGVIAMDAALQTTANATIPQIFATFVHPEVVEEVTAPLTSTKIFDEMKGADWADEQSTFPVAELLGSATGYSDYGRGTTSDSNLDWEVRDVARFQTFITIGDLEQEKMSKAKIDLLKQKQKAAARTLEILENKINFFGVDGKAIYGLLTDPNLPSAVTPENVNSKVKWSEKDAVAIYNDILKMFNSIAEASNGYVTFDTPMVLCVPPAVLGNLAKVTQFGIAPTLEVLKKYFPNLDFLAVPELNKNGVAEAMLIVKEIAGEPVGKFGIVEKVRTGRVVLEHSSMSQKWSAGTSGLFLFRPYGIARMTGIQS